MEVRSMCESINSALHTDLVPADFASPSSERIQALFRCFLMHIFGIPESTLSHLPLDCLSNDDDAEMTFRAAPLIILHQTMNAFVSDLQVEMEFSMCDLITPDPRKFRMWAQLIADYIRFFETTVPVWAETCAFYNDQRAQLEDYQQRLEDAERKREQASADHDSQKRRENGLLAELGQKQTEFSKLYAKLEEQEAQRAVINKAIEDEKFRKSELLMERDTQELQLEQVSMQLVSSPERVLKERDQFRQELLECREQCDFERNKHRDIMAQIAMAPSVDKLIDKVEEDVQQILVKQKDGLNAREMEMSDVGRMWREAERQMTKTAERIKEMEFEGVEEDQNHNQEQKVHSQRMEELAGQTVLLEKDIANLKKGGSVQPAAERKLQLEVSALRSQKIDRIAGIRLDMETLSENYKAYMHCYEQKKRELTEDITSWSKIVDQVDGEIAQRDVFADLNGTCNMSLL